MWMPWLTCGLDVTGLQDNGVMTAFSGGWHLPFMSESLFPDLPTKTSLTNVIEDLGLDCKLRFSLQSRV
jgi:hypothetical protein